MKIVYMGTPDFAVAPLAALVENGYEVEAVITQPDKPKGRGKTMMPTPVKEEALKHEIPVLQPVKVRDPEFVEKLKSLAPDIIVVAAFGQIIPKSILDMPKFGCINIHASLLPKYRGAAPIQQAVIDGEKESGVTIMQMGTGLDTGDMISRIVVPLAKDETGGSLFDKLAEAGAELLIHIGIDTVSMDGKGFVKKVADGAKVRKGDVLIEADLDAIKAAGHPATTMMILTNADDFSKVEKTAAGTVTTADLAMKIEK